VWLKILGEKAPMSKDRVNRRNIKFIIIENLKIKEGKHRFGKPEIPPILQS